MQAKQSKITLFLIEPIYELSETMDIRGPKWAPKKIAAHSAHKQAIPLGAKPPLSFNPRNAPDGRHYSRSVTMDIRGPKWAPKKIAAHSAHKQAIPLGAKPPLSFNPRNAPDGRH